MLPQPGCFAQRSPLIIVTLGVPVAWIDRLEGSGRPMPEGALVAASSLQGLGGEHDSRPQLRGLLRTFEIHLLAWSAMRPQSHASAGCKHISASSERRRLRSFQRIAEGLCPAQAASVEPEWHASQVHWHNAHAPNQDITAMVAETFRAHAVRFTHQAMNGSCCS